MRPEPVFRTGSRHAAGMPPPSWAPPFTNGRPHEDDDSPEMELYSRELVAVAALEVISFQSLKAYVMCLCAWGAKLK